MLQKPGPFPDAAYSTRGSALVLCYALWERPEDDAQRRVPLATMNGAARH